VFRATFGDRSLKRLDDFEDDSSIICGTATAGQTYCNIGTLTLTGCDRFAPVF
jgi:hypothetical protein